MQEINQDLTNRNDSLLIQIKKYEEENVQMTEERKQFIVLKQKW